MWSGTERQEALSSFEVMLLMGIYAEGGGGGRILTQNTVANH